MSKTSTLQDQLLNELRRSHSAITMFLINGFQLRGIITGFDSFVVVLDSEGRQQMVYKHAISTIVPGVPIALGG